LETYPLPAKLVGTETAFGQVPKRVAPIFRDRAELSASNDLGAELMAALHSSLFLLVICSTASAKSRWVGEEVQAFKRRNGESRILALIVDGEPYGSDKPGLEDQECFPLGLRFKMGPDRVLSDIPAEPIAADLRAGKDGRRLAKLKLIAGLTGVRLDDLVQRETQRRVRRLALFSAASFAGMLLAGGLAIYANAQRIEAVKQRKIAEKETATARAASDYLIGTFKLINPATENPRSISALTLLARGAERARVELADQPAIHAQILQAMGQAYNNLGLSSELVNMVQQSLPAIRRAGSDGVGALLTLAAAYQRLGKNKEALGAADLAKHALGGTAKVDPKLVADIASREGEILYADGATKPALAVIDRALRLYRESPDTPPAALATALATKGALLTDEQQFADADAALRECLAIRQRAFGERHLATAAAWGSLALNDLGWGRLSAAERESKNALAIERVVLDPDNPKLADAYSTEGQILQAEHKLPEAEAALTHAIATYKKAFGRPHYMTGIALQYLGMVESDRGRTDLALADLAEAKHNYDVGYGKLNPNHGDLLVWRAEVLAKAGRRDEALRDCAAGIEILDKLMGPTDGFTKADAAICKKL
jgi:tetratricopeptide (TPR) repeat protein